MNGLKVFGTQDYDSNTELAQISDYNQYGEVLDYDPDLSLIPNSSKLLKDLYTNIHQNTGSQIEKTSNSVKFTREKSKVDGVGQSYALYGIPKTNFTTPKTNYLTIVTNFRITNGDGNCRLYILLQGTGGRIIRQVRCTNTDSDVYYTGRYIIKLEGITGFDKSDFEIRLGVVYRYNGSNGNPVQAPETFSATFYELEVLDGIHPEVTHIKRDSYTRSEIYNKQEIQTILQDYETKPEEPVKPDLSWFLPSEVYVTCNDVSSRVRDNRTYSAEIYLDHCLKSNPQDESLSFKNAAGLKLDSVAFVENSYYDGNNEVINNGKTVDTQTKQISIQSDKYKESTKTLKVISTKASVQTSKPRILCIGDSVTAKTGANNTYGNGDNCYWQYVKELFYMDKIDGSNDNMDCIMLGNIQRDTWNLSYNGESYQLQGNACGLGSRSLADYLHRPQVCKSTQEGWDNMGFGDGSGTDYKGTTEQVHKMVTENWKGYTGNNPEIPFYNKDKAETENISFDLGIWLERYRTMDDEGNRLTWGDERIGSLITSEDLLKSINCCKPTHVIMAHGTNDYGTLADYIQNQKWFAEYMTENYPDVFVGIFVPDVAGTYWIDRYPEFIVTSNSPIKSSSRLDKMQEICTTFNANSLYPKVYPMPAFFTAPTAYGLMLQPVPSPEVICDVTGNNAYKFNRQKCIGDYPSGHPGSMAHATWAYQIYSWIKYTMSL